MRREGRGELSEIGCIYFVSFTGAEGRWGVLNFFFL